jgi:hypothetical protein
MVADVAPLIESGSIGLQTDACPMRSGDPML